MLVRLCLSLLSLVICSLCLPITTPELGSVKNQTINAPILVMTNISQYEDYMLQNSTFSALTVESAPILIKETGEVCSNTPKEKTQYCVKVTSAPTTYQDEIGAPLTACLDSRYGEGGSTSKQFTVEVDLSKSFNFNIASVTLIGFGTSYGVSATNSITFSLSDSCDVTKGNIVQMWGYPFYSTGNIRYRSFQIGRTGRRKNWSDWSDDQEVTLASTIQPATKCIGSVDESICGQNPVRRKFTVPGEPIQG